MYINYFRTQEYRFSLPRNYAGHKDGDIHSTQTQSMSPYSSEKDTEQTMRNKPPAAEMVTYTRLNRIKHLATSKKRENQIPALFLLLEQKGKRKRKMLKTSSTLVPCSINHYL